MDFLIFMQFKQNFKYLKKTLIFELKKKIRVSLIIFEKIKFFSRQKI